MCRFYRYAAADCPERRDQKAISYVLAGGLMAALLPRNRPQYGSVGELSLCRLLFLGICSVISLLVLAEIPKPKLTRKRAAFRCIFPLEFVVGMTLFAIGYALMSYMMQLRLAGGERGTVWHIGQCNNHPMACCGDVRTVIFYWKFDPTIRRH